MFDNFKCRLENIRVCGQVWSCEVSLPSTAGRQRSGSTQEEAQKFSPRDQNRGDRWTGCTCILSTMCATHGARAGDTTWVTRSVHAAQDGSRERDDDDDDDDDAIDESKTSTCRGLRQAWKEPVALYTSTKDVFAWLLFLVVLNHVACKCFVLSSFHSV